MRDHCKLKAFHLADELAVLVYEATRSFRELEYQVSLAPRLGYLRTDAHGLLHAKCIEASKVLAARIRSLRGTPSQPNSPTA